VKRVVFILFLLFAFCIISNDLSAQGRRREHRNQRRGGGGSSNAFAYGYSKSKKSRGAKVGQGGWVYKPTRPGKKQNMEQRNLFTRYRTSNKKYKSNMQARINRDRAKNRVHGNSSFSKRRY
jgi:hypothetical protein